MPISFSISDLIEIILFVVGIVGFYWKLDKRLSLVEQTQKEANAQRRQMQEKIEFHESKTEKKLDSIAMTIQEIKVDIAKIASSK